ncbi:MAG: hypothetical protein ACI9OJ_004894, partial [Myxococcota bacterium]
MRWIDEPGTRRPMGDIQFLPVDGASLLQSAVWYGAFVLALFA